jgi:hypothetical protein
MTRQHHFIKKEKKRIQTVIDEIFHDPFVQIQIKLIWQQMVFFCLQTKISFFLFHTLSAFAQSNSKGKKKKKRAPFERTISNFLPIQFNKVQRNESM